MSIMARHKLIDHELDLSAFDAHYQNDVAGAAAYAPAVLLEAVLFDYSHGLVSSRSIERACRENVIFIALTRDAAPHFTTIAVFVSQAGHEIAQLFTQVLFLCDRQGLIGREMFAIDGVTLPANASEASRLESAVRKMLAQHRVNDGLTIDAVAATARKGDRLQGEAAELRQWLRDNPRDRADSRGSIRKSNRTDAESAKMATSKGVLQGYIGVVAVDARSQVIVAAQAYDTGGEQELLLPIIAAIKPILSDASVITADAGYHSEVNLQALESEQIDARIAGVKLRGAIRQCGPCPLRTQCLRKPDVSQTRQVVFFQGEDITAKESATDRTKRRIDSPIGGARYARRLGIVEPVFANLRHNKRLTRFTLRERCKVDRQWKLHCREARQSLKTSMKSSSRREHPSTNDFCATVSLITGCHAEPRDGPTTSSAQKMFFYSFNAPHERRRRSCSNLVLYLSPGARCGS